MSGQDEQMVVEVVYLARLREAFGVERESLSVPQGSTAGQVLQLLRERGDREQLGWDNLRPVVGRQVVEWEQQLYDGDSMGILPPITGG